jgi:hypothetical protein
MKRISALLFFVTLTLFTGGLSFAVDTGNGMLSGGHYNLNIIGVPKDKTVPAMDGSNRHTIFVPLQSGGDVGRLVKIKFVVGNDFRVLDGNATDDNEAKIQVPYEYCQDLQAGCYDLLSFYVFARGLGKPGPDVGTIVTAECEYLLDVVDELGTSGLTCQDTLLLGSFGVKRPGGKPRTYDITDIFRASGCLDMNASGACDSGDLEFENIWIFNIPYLESYMWDYDNNGLKLMQIRFYPTTSGYIGYVK